jgi:hypothetical protein
LKNNHFRLGPKKDEKRWREVAPMQAIQHGLFEKRFSTNAIDLQAAH